MKSDPIAILEALYGHIWDYSLAVYTKTTNKIRIRHRASGVVLDRAYKKHLNNPTESDESIKRYLFEQEASKVWNGKYLYFNFISYRYPVFIYALDINKLFRVCPRQHLKGSMSRDEKTYRNRLKILKDAQDLYSDKYLISLDGDTLKFKRFSDDEIFKQSIKSFNRYKPIFEYTVKDFEKFKETASEVHGHKFSYRLIDSNFLLSTSDIVVIDNSNQREYIQKAKSHLSGQKPYKYFYVSDFNSFVLKANEIHNNKYKYELNDSKYTKTSLIKIIDKETNSFGYQRADTHLRGFIPKNLRVNNSFESSLEGFLDKKLINYSRNIRPDYLEGKELDYLLDSYNLAIEMNGKAYHHSSDNFFTSPKDSNYHLNKYLTCLDNGIHLIHIFEFENLGKWFRNLSNYLDNPDRYEITFLNDKRTYNSLKYYGKSRICLKQQL